jgi:hypothetical protein
MLANNALLDAVEIVLFWDLPESAFIDGLQTQCGLMLRQDSEPTNPF